MSIFAIVIAYFLGAIPFGMIVAGLSGAGNLQEHGSGNTGATNVARVAGLKLGALTLILDALKGASAVWIAASLAPHAIAWTGLAVVMGHIYSIFLGFKGGKGVATALGVFWAVYWPIGLIFSAFWLAVYRWKRISSLSSIAAMTLTTFIVLLHAFPSSDLPRHWIFVHFIIAVLVIARHRGNIARIIKGEEKQIA